MSRILPIAGVIIVALAVIGGIVFLTGDDDDGSGDGTATVTGTRGATSASGTSTGAGQTATVETAQSLLTAAAAQWDATNSAHFDLRVDGKAYVDNARTLELRSASGDILRPDSVEATAKISVQLISFDIGIIAIGDTMYQTNLVTGDWEVAPADFGYNPAVLFSPTDGISAVVKKVQNPQLAGNENVAGHDARVVTGTVTGDDIKKITSGAIEGDVIDVTLWIDAETSDILRVRLSAPATADNAAVTWTLDITKQNEPVTITAPEVS